MSSFKKVSKEISAIPGTRLIPNKNCLYTSTGLPALDAILGGGLAIGTLTLIDEDTTGYYSEILIKYFISEGVLSKHDIFVGSLDAESENILKHLPGEGKVEETKNEVGGEMKIAWRYQDLKSVDSSVAIGGQCFGHSLDLNTNLQESALKSVSIFTWNDGDQEDFLNKVKNFVEENERKSSNKTIIRLAVTGFGSPLWDSSQLAKTLYCLRGLLRNTHSVALMTVCGKYFQDKSVLEKCIHLSDCCIRLTDFSETQKTKNPLIRDFHGVFHVIKLAPVNSIVANLPLADLAFKLRRRKFIIETLHLPPELEDSAEREQDDSAFLSCSMTAKKLNLDF